MHVSSQETGSRPELQRLLEMAVGRMEETCHGLITRERLPHGLMTMYRYYCMATLTITHRVPEATVVDFKEEPTPWPAPQGPTGEESLGEHPDAPSWGKTPAMLCEYHRGSPDTSSSSQPPAVLTAFHQAAAQITEPDWHRDGSLPAFGQPPLSPPPPVGPDPGPLDSDGRSERSPSRARSVSLFSSSSLSIPFCPTPRLPR
ncbi:unnamed protein product [Boreogadus saida]